MIYCPDLHNGLLCPWASRRGNWQNTVLLPNLVDLVSDIWIVGCAFGHRSRTVRKKGAPKKKRSQIQSKTALVGKIYCMEKKTYHTLSIWCTRYTETDLNYIFWIKL